MRGAVCVRACGCLCGQAGVWICGGIVRLCAAMCGYVWPCVAMCGRVWLFVAPMHVAHVWMHVAHAKGRGRGRGQMGAKGGGRGGRGWCWSAQELQPP